MSLMIKICGLTRRDDVAAACDCGADYVGCVMVPNTPRFVPEEAFHSIFAECPVPRVLVVADMPLEELNALLARLRPEIVQLHGKENGEYARSVRGAEVWRAWSLTSESDVAAAAAYPAEAVVADSPRGGSGMPSDWRLAAYLARRKKVLLAGGLSPANAADAARIPGLFGLDASSGLESSPGVKSFDKIRKFMEACKQ